MMIQIPTLPARGRIDENEGLQRDGRRRHVRGRLRVLRRRWLGAWREGERSRGNRGRLGGVWGAGGTCRVHPQGTSVQG